MILKRKLCRICDCKYLCEYLAERANKECFDCEDVRDLVLNIIENNLEEEEEK